MKSIPATIIILFLISVMLGVPVSIAETGGPEPTIAVTAESDLPGASVSQRAERAPFILIFNGDGNLVETHSFPIRRDAGADRALAAWLAEKKIKILISGNIDKNLMGNLKQNQISAIETRGSVSRAVRDALK